MTFTLRRQSKLALLTASVCILGLVAGGGISAKKARFLTREEIAVEWVGISESESYLLRLALAPEGYGIGAFSFLNESPRAFRILSWEYEPPQIRFETDAAQFEVDVIRGKIIGIKMQLTMSGESWRTNYMLRREAELEQRWRNLKEAMGEVPK